MKEPENYPLPWKLTLQEGLIVAANGQIVATAPDFDHETNRLRESIHDIRFRPGHTWANEIAPFIVASANSASHRLTFTEVRP